MTANQAKTQQKSLAIFTGFAIIAGMKSIESNLLISKSKQSAREGISVRSAAFLWNVINPWPFLFDERVKNG